MRFPLWFCSFIFLVPLCLTPFAAAEIKIKVVDPQDAVVAGAQVQLLEPGESVRAVQSTSAEGVVVFRETASKSSSYRAQVAA
ncbi:MAG: hypothetical protein WBV41_21535, partial [Terriglobales bacterium]